MNPKNFSIGKTMWLIILLIVAGVGVGFYALNNYVYKEKQGDGMPSEPYQATLTGVQVCLPHKDMSGPQTKECAVGMKTDAGEYFALDFMLMSQTPPEIQNGERFTASGVITPIERLSTDHWQKYNVEGIFSVTNSVEIEEKIDSVGFAWKFEKAETLNGDGNPNTNVFLEVKYPSGEVVNKLIQVSHGSCNELSESEEDSVTGSRNVQCYGAGFGYVFKITKGEQSYLVMKKEFDEGSPDYTPPAQEYEVVAEFPLK